MKFAKRLAACVVIVLAAFLLMGAPDAQAQHGSEGTVTLTVLDSSGGVVQGAQLELRDLTTNDLRKAETQEQGTHTFVNLSLGKYKLTVSKAGFQTQVFTDVIVQAAQTTDISVMLRVGATNETVEVRGGTAPLVETTTNAIGTTIDLKQIEDLPLQNRDLTALSQLVPGYNGTWDGLPSIAQGNNIDGVIGSPSRMKFGGNAQAIVSPRIEAIEEMTVQTEQLNLDQGFGQANMQLNFVTRRGSNSFHGRVYDDFQNSALNANSWLNDTSTALGSPAPKNLLHRNDFGASLGGPILKDKLFFFGSYAELRIPGSYTTSNSLFTPAAQAGNFTYNNQTVNLFTLAQNYNATHPGANLPTAVLDCTSAAAPANCPGGSGGVLAAANASTSAGQLIPSSTGDPNLNQINWQVNNPQVSYFPAVRVDYNASEKMRVNLAWNMTKDNYPGANPPDFPGPTWAKTGAGNSDKSYTLGLGFTWTLSPTLVNELRGGFLYNVSLGAYNAPPLSLASPQLGWNYPSAPYPQGAQMSGTIFYSGINTEYPVFTASDTMTWQRGAHSMNFGFSWWREQNHYYNPAAGYPIANFGLANGDPALGVFTTGAGGTLAGASPGQQAQAEQLYAILAGRISGIQGGGGGYPFITQANNYVQTVGRYNLDELTGGEGLFFQDSYRIRPNLTLNFGLRWDFTAADKDLSKLYHSASPAAVFGPSGIGNLFNPGALTSDPNGLNPMLTQNPNPYNSWNVAPQPAFGFAWNPKSRGTLVIRGGFSLRKFTEPQQYVWNQASDYGSFYYQSFFLNANGTGGPGAFKPGTLSISDFDPSAPPTQAFPPNVYGLSPQTFQKSEAASDFTFLGPPGLNGMNPKIQQPYTESWNLGVQQQLGESRVLEIRYVGSRSERQWLNINPGEINIFGTTAQLPTSFLTQFKAAQANLAINQTNGITSFADNGYPGQQATPIFDAAFAGEAPGGPGVPLSDYGPGSAPFISQLQTGQAGAMAGILAGVGGTVPYFCNLVGASFLPCANNVAAGTFNAAGAGYPINFFQANPYAQGSGTSYTEAEGYSNYNALQVDFRERPWHGLQFDANYTWSHTLGIATQNNWQGQGALFTLRDMRLSYGPTLYDLRHVIHISGTYDLPFGKGKQFANSSNVLDHFVGGWTVGTIFTFQTGAPFLVLGGTNTFNDYGDGGVNLTGVTASGLQSSIGKYPIQGTPNVAFINPKYLPSAGGGYITANATPGTIGQRVWLYGPHNTYDDISVAKHFPITERFRFTFQAEMLNAFNHPTFGPTATNGGANFGYNALQNPGFGLSGNTLNPQNSPNGGARIIELRANFEF
jgi:hypothetical protein